MPIWLIIVIVVVVVLILVALVAVLPRTREKARVRKQERELGRRREQAVSEQREEADARARRAEEAEQRARIAEQEARRERAAAELHQEQATMHERGMADHELVDDHEREEFAGTSAVREEDLGAERESSASRTSAYEEGRRSADNPERVEDFRQGRRDEEE